jgi:hypothetical protein
MHWCPQETEALLMLLGAIPLVGYYFKSLHAKWHAKNASQCDHEGHNHENK